MVSNSLPRRNKTVPRQNGLLATRPTLILLHSPRHPLHPYRNTILTRDSNNGGRCRGMDRLGRIRRLEECDGFQHATDAPDIGCGPANPRFHSDDYLAARRSEFSSVPLIRRNYQHDHTHTSSQGNTKATKSYFPMS